MTPVLTQGPIAKTPDERIDNLINAFSDDTGEFGDTIRWLLANWKHARKALTDIGKTSHPHVMAQLAHEGLEVQGE